MSLPESTRSADLFIPRLVQEVARGVVEQA